MPTVKDNTNFWDRYAWPKGGDEWSAPWGTADRQWQLTVYPRIAKSLVNCRRALEIGPGMGRWTERLLPHVDHLVVVDVSKTALEGLHGRFVGERWSPRNLNKLEVHLGSGTDLPVPSDFIDFVFSFDSLVHADQDTLDAYLMECSRALKDDGVGFIHHANMESGRHWRGKASADGIRAGLAKAGLHCYVQEISTWVHEQDLGLTDCFTFFGKDDRGGPKCVTTDVLAEANQAKRLASLYDSKVVFP